MPSKDQHLHQDKAKFSNHLLLLIPQTQKFRLVPSNKGGKQRGYKSLSSFIVPMMLIKPSQNKLSKFCQGKILEFERL